MNFMDWFWAGVAATLGWVAAPFIIVAVILVLMVAVLVIYMVWLWLVDFCKTAVQFYRWIFTGKE